MFFDTHAHVDDRAFDADRDTVIASLREKGIDLVVDPGCDIPSSRKAVGIAERHDMVYAAVGVHPHDCKDMTDDDFDDLISLAQHPKVVAIGEIGLDYHYDFSPRDIQKKRFAEQLKLSRELDLPVIIHQREATEDCMDIVRRIKVKRGVFHCFSGSLETAKELIDLGYYLSFTGVVTFKNAKKAPEILRWIPKDRYMIETDSPYMTPEPFRGKRNDPGYVRLVAEKIAEIRGESVEEVARQTMENGKRFFEINTD